MIIWTYNNDNSKKLILVFIITKINKETLNFIRILVFRAYNVHDFFSIYKEE
jgi:hypothetical protein